MGNSHGYYQSGLSHIQYSMLVYPWDWIIMSVVCMFQCRYWGRHEYIAKGYADHVSGGYSDDTFDYLEEYFNHSYKFEKQGGYNVTLCFNV